MVNDERKPEVDLEERLWFKLLLFLFALMLLLFGLHDKGGLAFFDGVK
ncbi:MAG: hypothetical protein WC551_12750 [Patescibacteria group bacterium]